MNADKFIRYIRHLEGVQTYKRVSVARQVEALSKSLALGLRIDESRSKGDRVEDAVQAAQELRRMFKARREEFETAAKAFEDAVSAINK